jgi:DNA-binding transcriptional ArsR family regulator
MDKLIDIKKMTDGAKNACHFLKALSHETRLLAICYIGDGEKSVHDLENFLGTTQSTISQHLAKLRDKNILDTRRDGNQVYYHVSNKKALRIIAGLQDMFCN